MTAQAIESVPQQQSMNSIHNNQSSLFVPDVANSFIVNDKINVATTLALLVGLIQVSVTRSEGRTICKSMFF